MLIFKFFYQVTSYGFLNTMGMGSGVYLFACLFIENILCMGYKAIVGCA